VTAIAAGAAVGGILLLGAIAAGIIFCLKRKNRNHQNANLQPPPVQQIYSPVNQNQYGTPPSGDTKGAYGNVVPTQGEQVQDPRQSYQPTSPAPPYGGYYSPPPAGHNELAYQNQNLNPNRAYNNGQPGYGQQQQQYAAHETAKGPEVIASPVSEISSSTTPYSAHATLAQGDVSPNVQQQQQPVQNTAYPYPVVAEMHGSSVQGPVEMPGGR
jgi:hypothetical protein